MQRHVAILHSRNFLYQVSRWNNRAAQFTWRDSKPTQGYLWCMRNIFYEDEYLYTENLKEVFADNLQYAEIIKFLTKNNKVRAEDNYKNPQLIQTGIYSDPVHNAARRDITPQTNIKVNGSDAAVIPINTGMGMGRGVTDSVASSTINLELTSVVDILKTIADNSARNEQIVQLLAAIVSNTAAKNGDTTTADLLKLITTAGGKSNTSAPITALNSILNNSTGKDISSAVYQIAKN